ncbi:uncharacterized protein LOC134269898 [Saccostrea cucullata]|uniref:uncharacterized protein LOC134269898 n=1 Tax=Saccostrea cuccullata TaxID=36930 RepID=UPI002ED30667
MHSSIFCLLVFLQFSGCLGTSENGAIPRLEKMLSELFKENEAIKLKMVKIEIDNKNLNQKIEKVVLENNQMKKEIEKQSRVNFRQSEKLRNMEHIISDLQKCSKNCKILKTLKGHTLFQKTESWRQNGNYSESLIKNKTQELSFHERKNINNHQRRRVQRLLMTDIPPTTTDRIAFFSYMSKPETNLGHHQTIIFDVAHTNVGNNYSPHTGAFTAPSHGVYVFTWKVYIASGGYVYTELIQNSNSVCGSYTGAQDVHNIIASTDVVVLELNPGDEVHIRTPPDASLSGTLYSTRQYRSSFNGWRLF